VTQASEWNQFEEVEYQVAHTTVGRIRIHVPRLANDPEYAIKLQHLVESLNFVISLRINPKASSVVVNYDADAARLATALSALVDAIQQARTTDIPLIPTPKAPPSTQETNELEYLDLPVPEKSSHSHRKVVHQASVVSRSACLIFNPIAGQSNAKQDMEKIRSILEPELNLDVRTTTPEVDTYQLTKDAFDQRFEVIIASGGDGTVSAVASAVVETDIPLGIIPWGTANAFANALGIPTSIEGACQMILQGATRKIGIARCNSKLMLLLAGIGFEAEVVEKANRETKKQLGVLAYIRAGMQQLQDYKTFTAHIETEEKNITVNAAAITVASVAPPTSLLAQGPACLRPDDGVVDVTLITSANSLDALAAGFHLFQTALSDTAANHHDISYFQAKRLIVTAEPPQKVAVDGELIGTTPLVVEVIPASLTLVVHFVQKEFCQVLPSKKLPEMGGSILGGMAGSAVGEVIGGSIGVTVMGPIGMVVGSEVGAITGQVVGGYITEGAIHKVVSPGEAESSLASENDLSEIQELLQKVGSEKIGTTLGEIAGSMLGQVFLGSTGINIGKSVAGMLGWNVGRWSSTFHNHLNKLSTGTGALTGEIQIEEKTQGNQNSEVL